MKSETSTDLEVVVKSVFRNKEFTQGGLIALLAVSFVFLQFLPIKELEISISILIFVIIAWVLPTVRGTTLIICIVLLWSGIGLMLFNRIPINEWLVSFRINLTIVAVFLSVPLIGITVKTGGYVRALEVTLSRKMNNPRFLFLGTNILTHILGVILNIGSISIVNHLTKASKVISPRLVGNAINRGFTTTIFWSPYFSAMALILSQLPIRWSNIFLYSIGLSFIAMIVSYLLERKTMNELDVVKEIYRNIDEKEMKKAKQKVLELFILLLIIMGAVLILEAVTPLSMVLVIVLLSFFFPLIWCLVSGRFFDYVKEFKGHIFVTIPRMKKEIVLFLIAGFFSGAIIYTEMNDQIVTLIVSIFGTNTLLISIFLSLMVLVTGLIGIHPIVVITILITGLNPEMLGMSAEYYAVLLLASWGISNLTSPATAVNNLLSNLLNKDIIEISVRWNIKFVLIMLTIVPIYLMALGI